MNQDAKSGSDRGRPRQQSTATPGVLPHRNSPPEDDLPLGAHPETTRVRYQLRFTKLDDLRWISHRDLVRVLERGLRRCNVPLSMSDGYHPKPRMSFPLALALGIGAHSEIMEVEFTREMDTEVLCRDLNAQMPPGLRILSAQRVDRQNRAPTPSVAEYRISLAGVDLSDVAAVVARFLEAENCFVPRARDGRVVDARLGLIEIGVREGHLCWRQSIPLAISVGPREVLVALGLAHLERDGGCLERTNVHWELT